MDGWMESHLCVYMCTHVHAYVYAHVCRIREQLTRVSPLLPPCGSQELKLLGLEASAFYRPKTKRTKRPL